MKHIIADMRTKLNGDLMRMQAPKKVITQVDAIAKASEESGFQRGCFFGFCWGLVGSAAFSLIAHMVL